MAESSTSNGVDAGVDYSTDVVIVGTGPAGGSLGAFMGSLGVRGIIIGMTSTTAETPRAHITNMAAAECLRDIGVEEECRQLASPMDDMAHTRWGYSMAGEEYARVYSWGNGPALKGKYEIASPCEPMDLPQTQLEPVLIRKATMSGFVCRFNTEFLSFEDHNEKGYVDVVVKDLVFDKIQKIRCKYLFGADGARSRIIRQLDLPFEQNPGGGLAWNVLVKADLSKHVQYKKGSLHWCYQHDLEHPDFCWIGFPRMVKPWHEWVFIMFPVPGYKPEPPPTHDQWTTRIRQMIGDDSIDFKILNVSKWIINDVVAKKYAKGNVFCLGDAVHRHPPSNGLGSNTCVQDAYNLAWKIAYVVQGKSPREHLSMPTLMKIAGKAGKELLDSYEVERQPVGKAIVERAFQGYLDHLPVWKAAGILPPEASSRVAEWSEMTANATAGRKRRKDFIAAIQGTRYECQGLGIEMNQRYQSNAVYQADQGEVPAFIGHPVLDHSKSTFPGSRVPHVWLNHRIPDKPIPIMDLVGKGRFTILTGIGGEAWKDAGHAVSEALNVPIATFSIGFRQDYEDVYFEWDAIREIEEDGCILVRPDRFIAWRSMEMIDIPQNMLLKVMRQLLSLTE